MRATSLALALAAVLASLAVAADEPVPVPARVTCSPDGRVIGLTVFISNTRPAWLTLTFPADICGVDRPVDVPPPRAPVSNVRRTV